MKPFFLFFFFVAKRPGDEGGMGHAKPSSKWADPSTNDSISTPETHRTRKP
jgi:hypothetical protein